MVRVQGLAAGAGAGPGPGDAGAGAAWAAWPLLPQQGAAAWAAAVAATKARLASRPRITWRVYIASSPFGFARPGHPSETFLRGSDRASFVVCTDNMPDVGAAGK